MKKIFWYLVKSEISLLCYFGLINSRWARWDRWDRWDTTCRVRTVSFRVRTVRWEAIIDLAPSKFILIPISGIIFNVIGYALKSAVGSDDMIVKSSLPGEIFMSVFSAPSG
jgi:hypothetical protein